MIKAYIEVGGYAECVANIADEWTYMALLPCLEKLAKDRGGILTESVIEDTRTHRNDADTSETKCPYCNK
jgi:hypothetical protein